MKNKAWALGLGLVLSWGQAQAWMAIAMDPTGRTFITASEGSPESAKQQAVKGCEKMTKTSCTPVGDAVHGTTMVVALGDRGMRWFADPNPAAAAKKAMDACAAAYNRCRLWQAQWDDGRTFGAIARDSAGQWFISLNHKTLPDARQNALDACKKQSADGSSCNIPDDHWIDSYAALAFAKAGEQEFIGTSQENEAQARKRALSGCSRLAPRGKCVVTHVEFNTAPQREPAGLKQLLAKIEREDAKVAAAPAAKPVSNNGDCRPNSRNLTCQSNCQNGSCVITYENGCKVRVQVQAKFDPFTNQWTYPSPSC